VLRIRTRRIFPDPDPFLSVSDPDPILISTTELPATENVTTYTCSFILVDLLTRKIQVKIYKKYRFRQITSLKQWGSRSVSDSGIRICIKMKKRIRIHIKVKSRIRICIKVKRLIRIGIKIVWIHNTAPKSDVNLKTGLRVDDETLPWSLFCTACYYSKSGREVDGNKHLSIIWHSS
jgi:hypothetical protein